MAEALDVDALEQELQILAVPGVRIGARIITAADVADLRPIEAAHISRAVPSRQAEYATGRRLLRDLMGVTGAIATAADRRPVLPPGLVASLAHDRSVAIAAVGPETAVASLGIDVEPDEPLAAEVAAIVLREDESGLDPHLAFTLKEAVYKAWSGTGGAILEHHDVRLTVGADQSGRATFRGDIVAYGASFDGAFSHAHGRWLALVAVMAQDVKQGVLA